MKQFQDFLAKALNTLGFLNDDQKVSLTNLSVIIFLAITSFRSLFGGATFSFNDFHWTVENIDFAATLPLLFSLINYSAKRTTLTKNQTVKDESTNAS